MEQTYMIRAIIEMHPDLQKFALKLTANLDSANDLVQDSILKALDNTDRYVRQDNLKGWLYTIMRNVFVNNYRRSQREPLFFDYDFTDCHALAVQEDWGGNIYDRKFIYKVINDLPENMKQPFVLFIFGLKYREIAEKLDLPIGIIKKRLHFARKKLQDELKEFS